MCKKLPDMTNLLSMAAVFGMLVCVGCGVSSPYAVVTEPSGEHMLVGEFPLTVLLSDTSFAGWYTKEYQGFEPEKKILAPLSAAQRLCDIVICMGTWCSDSHREVPRFIKVAEAAGIPLDRIRLHAVDHRKNSPENAAVAYTIKKVPTIIFFRDGKELGRITETPEVSLETDMVQILQK